MNPLCDLNRNIAIDSSVKVWNQTILLFSGKDIYELNASNANKVEFIGRKLLANWSEDVESPIDIAIYDCELTQI